MIPCKRCKKEFDDSIPQKDLHDHHIIPKGYGGYDKGNRCYLCKPCHDEIHIRIKKLTEDFLNEHS